MTDRESNRRRRRRSLLLFVFTAGALVVAGGYTVNRMMRIASTRSTVFSIANALTRDLAQTPVHEQMKGRAKFELTPAERDELFGRLGKSYNLDARPGWKPGKPLVDFWDKRFRITFTTDPDGVVSVEVASDGPDKNANTPDDISVRTRIKAQQGSPSPTGMP